MEEKRNVNSGGRGITIYIPAVISGTKGQQKWPNLMVLWTEPFFADGDDDFQFMKITNKKEK